MEISQSMYDDIVAHALADAPDECCGMIASSEGRATEVYRATNTAHSPLKYVIDPKELLRIYSAIDDAGWDLGAIYHSHTRSPPIPSQTDINLATYPEALYIIVGVHGPEPEVRAFRIVDAKVEEVELSVV
jgi:proteasome lid subunit RPN8/RPN11